MANLRLATKGSKTTTLEVGGDNDVQQQRQAGGPSGNSENDTYIINNKKLTS